MRAGLMKQAESHVVITLRFSFFLLLLLSPYEIFFIIFLETIYALTLTKKLIWEITNALVYSLVHEYSEKLCRAKPSYFDFSSTRLTPNRNVTVKNYIAP